MSATSGGYVAFHRSLLDHPLMNQLPAAWFRIFVAILLRANWKLGVWWNGAQNIEIPPGSMVTSIEKLRVMTKTSAQQVRCALKYFSATSTITSKTTNHYTVLTVENWSKYQSLAEPDNKRNIERRNKQVTSQQRTGNEPTTTIEEGNQEIMEESSSSLWLPTSEELEQISIGIAAHRGINVSPDGQIVGRVAHHLTDLDDFRLWIGDLKKRLSGSQLKSFAFYVADASRWPSRRLEAIASSRKSAAKPRTARDVLREEEAQEVLDRAQRAAEEAVHLAAVAAGDPAALICQAKREAVHIRMAEIQDRSHRQHASASASVERGAKYPSG